jgi:RNA polymerase sigma factor (sigma-70 family)
MQSANQEGDTGVPTHSNINISPSEHPRPQEPRAPSDHEIIARIVSGDGEALAFLLTVRSGAALKYLCQQNRASRLDLMDLVQDVALKLIANDYKALRDFVGKNAATARLCSLERYVFVIARNHIQRLNKRAMKENTPLKTQNSQTSSMEVDESESGSPGNAFPDVSAQNETPRQIWREIDWTSAFTDANGRLLEFPGDDYKKDRLRIEMMDAIMILDDSRDRFVLIEYKLKGREPGEVAAALGTTEGNVYTICNRAQKKLRAILSKGERNHD